MKFKKGDLLAISVDWLSLALKAGDKVIFIKEPHPDAGAIEVLNPKTGLTGNVLRRYFKKVEG